MHVWIGRRDFKGEKRKGRLTKFLRTWPECPASVWAGSRKVYSPGSLFLAWRPLPGGKRAATGLGRGAVFSISVISFSVMSFQVRRATFRRRFRPLLLRWLVHSPPVWSWSCSLRPPMASLEFSSRVSWSW